MPIARDRYVYTLFLRLPGEPCLAPFYVGIGKRGTKRHLHHEREARSRWGKFNSDKIKFIRDAIAAGFEIYPELTPENMSIDEAYAREVELIAYYGRQDIGNGCLFNANDGGCGCHNPAPSTRARLAAAMSLAHNSGRRTGSYAKIAAANLGREWSSEFKTKISKARRQQQFEKGFVTGQCTTCHEIKSAAEFRVVLRRGKYEPRSKCKSCESIAAAERFQRNGKMRPCRAKEARQAERLREKERRRMMLRTAEPPA